MKELPLSKCEHDFILRAITEGKRLDGRFMYDYRKITVSFGATRGSCQVYLGQTKAFAQVSCSVVAPKPSRPHEGLLNINVELSPMAAPNFEVGRMSEYAVEINRLLERCIFDSRAVDQESLCIVVGEKVWCIRVDVHILNHDGNILDCASIAAITALSNFRRPDVTISGEEVTIHTLEDRHGVPITIHHMPIINTFAYFNKGDQVIIDPTEREELVMEGRIIVGMNIYQEICTLHVGGTVSLDRMQILKCAHVSATKSKEIIEMIKTSLVSDEQKRAKQEMIGFVNLLKEELIITCKKPSSKFITTEEDTHEKTLETVQTEIVGDQTSGEDVSKPNIADLVSIQGKGTGSLVPGKDLSWLPSDEDSDDMISVSQSTSTTQKPLVKSSAQKADSVQMDEDSEEEVVITLNSSDTLQVKK